MPRSSRLTALQPTAVNAILSEVRALQSRGKTLTSLMRGEPDRPTPPHIAEACARALRNGRTGYPDNRGEKPFREAISQKLQRDNSLSYDPATEVLATTGATFGIYAALMSLLNEGDEVLLPDPIYDAYQSPIRLAGGRIRPVASQIHESRLAITEQALEAAWTPAAKVLLLNTPWNPTGSVLTQQELAPITNFCDRRNVALLSDEIYEAVTCEGHQHLSPPAVALQLRDRSIPINSHSKTYSMTGWRVGYCAGPATFIQDAAAEALAGPQDCVAQMRREYTRRRVQVMARLAGIPGVRILPPEGGFFAMADARDLRIPSPEIRRRPGGEGTLRISFASGGDTLARGLGRLREGLTRIAESAA